MTASRFRCSVRLDCFLFATSESGSGSCTTECLVVWLARWIACQPLDIRETAEFTHDVACTFGCFMRSKLAVDVLFSLERKWK